ncbi:MAG: FHA domain-containing protein [Bacteroidales bacterium]|nr:FHA domain-containing protein [Bacteroidales bacterium]
MKGFKQCPNGHWYKNDLAQCPFCKGKPVNTPVNTDTSAAKGANSEESRVPPPVAPPEPIELSPPPPPVAPQEPVELPPPLPEEPIELPEATVELLDEPIELPPPPPIELPEEPIELPEATVELPEEPIELPEAAVELPEEPIELPEAAVELPEEPIELPEATIASPPMPIVPPPPSNKTDSNNVEPTPKEKPETKKDSRSSRRLVGWLVTYSFDPLGVGFEVYEGLNVIGSGANCNITINDETMSDRHATVLFRAEKYKIRDELSTFGTLVNGEDIETDAVDLRDGDVITMGETTFLFKSSLLPK